ncbi:hypothetical protein [Shinella zoogloeoides]|uniref:hypothetical protein n=1 Tax=Shinella zoogloeoides TaxID=352475 RepID=UPI00273EF162|nr:hypothetical protein [Shinella zoogloeoides]WLR90903.1 hypothetical protein Q9316_00570 [Shinella zoogloeoides]
MNKVTIKAAITSAAGVTLYTVDGKEINLPAAGYRTKSIMDEITRPLAKHKSVEIDLDSYSLEAKVEAKTGGLIRFVKKKLRDFVGHFNLGSYGASQVTSEGETIEQPAGPAFDPDQETLVAIVDGKEIPGMEKLEKQIEYAAFKDAKGLQRFLERLAKVIDKRGHSVQELLNFIERADLPIADDGTIVGYKILCFSQDSKDIFVDPHTRKVHQRVGSRVSMAESLVDPSRRVECSSGLHVARRGYVAGFRYDLITLIKVAPEDVIAVPYNEPDKMRAAAYHIVARVPDEGYALLCQNKPMTTHEPSAKILANVIAGDHIEVIEDVVIGGARGTNVVTTPRRGITYDKLASVAEVKTDVAKVEALDELEKTVATVSIKDVKKAVEEAVAEKKAEKEQRAAAKVAKADVKKAPTQVSPKKGGVNKQPSKVATRPAAPAKMSQPQKSGAAPKATREVPEKWREAYRRVSAGEISQREAERLYNISAKKLRALRREIEGK